jgi:pimeloyl-ACP methyl ester carboxylesterase
MMQSSDTKNRDTPWVLLRGWGRESGHWGHFPILLQQSLGVNVLCLDLPGTGTRVKERSPLSMKGLLDAVRQPYLNEMGGMGKRCYILSISMGSMVAANWHSVFPKKSKG